MTSLRPVLGLVLIVACGKLPDPPETPAAPQLPHPIANDARTHAAGPVLAADLAEDDGRIALTLGPMDLPAGHGHGHQMVRTPLLETTLPRGAWLTGFDVELVDGNGDLLPQAFLHHVNLILPDRADLFRPIMQRLVAAGEETQPISIPWPLGIPAPDGQRVLAYAMLHNPSHTDYAAVTVRMTIRFADGRRIAVQPFFIDVSPPPGSASWDLPPGRSERSWEGSPTVDGRILGVGGHLHQYGTELRFEDVTSGKTLFRLTPEIAPDGSLVGVDRKRFLRRLGLRLRADHVYRITAVYDNPTAETIPDGAMGAIGGIFRPSTPDWPAPDFEHPLLARDLEMLTTATAAQPHAH